MTKKEIIERYGKGDDYDEDRYEQSVWMSARIDKPVFMCFESFVRLEEKGLVELVKE